MMLSIQNLHASVNDREILKGISLDVKAGEVHAIMGPNGSGKSTLAGVLAGREAYEVTQGTVEFLGKDLLDMDPEERAREGVFLAFQYPVEIPGVSNTPLSPPPSTRFASIVASPSSTPPSSGCSEGEESRFCIWTPTCSSVRSTKAFGRRKKRNEIFQMAVLDPKLAILDETDSGLDIDALRIVSKASTPALKDRATHRGHALSAAAQLHRPRQGACASVRRRIVSRGWRACRELETRLWLDRDKLRPRRCKGNKGFSHHDRGSGRKKVYRSHFDQLEGSRLLRACTASEAWARSKRLGFPSVHDEDWKFTSLAPLAKVPFSQPSGLPRGACRPARTGEHSGNSAATGISECAFVPELSRVDRLPKGVIATSLALALAEQPELVDLYLSQETRYRNNAFTALNTAFLRDGAFVHVPRGVAVKEPLYIVTLSKCAADACVIHPRNLVLVDESSQLTLVEYYAALESRASFTNVVTGLSRRQ